MFPRPSLRSGAVRVFSKGLVYFVCHHSIKERSNPPVRRSPLPSGNEIETDFGVVELSQGVLEARLSEGITAPVASRVDEIEAFLSAISPVADDETGGASKEGTMSVSAPAVEDASNRAVTAPEVEPTETTSVPEGGGSAMPWGVEFPGASLNWSAAACEPEVRLVAPA